MSDEDFIGIEKNACPTAGACGGMYTANTMSSSFEALGMSLLGSSQMASPDQEKADSAAESARVGLALGYTIPKINGAAAEKWADAQRRDTYDELDRMLTPTSAGGRNWRASMAQDVAEGRPTEIDYLNGYVAKLGRETGVPTPLNEALSALIKTITEREKQGPGVLRIDGAVVQPVWLDREALATLPVEHRVDDLSRLMPNITGKGLRVKGLLEVPALAIGADHVTFHSLDGKYSASLTLQQARDYGILVYEVDGQPLPSEKGGPFRLVTPGMGDLCANVKGVGRIEITEGSGRDTRPSTAPCSPFSPGDKRA